MVFGKMVVFEFFIYGIWVNVICLGVVDINIESNIFC